MPDNGIETLLYDGTVKVRVVHNKKRHDYYVSFLKDGEWTKEVRKTGVTTYLGIIDKSQQLIPWAVGLFKDYLLEAIANGETITEEHAEVGCKLHSAEKEQAADWGTLAHEWIENYINFTLGWGALPDMPDDAKVQQAVNMFLDWVKRDEVKFLWAEKPIYSRLYDFVGKADFACISKRMGTGEAKKRFGDTKTSNGLYSSVKAQTAMYEYAETEESHEYYNGGRIALRISKDTEAEYMEKMNLKLAKGTIKEILPYKPFEAVYLDEEEDTRKFDFEGGLNAIRLFTWEREATKQLNALR